MMQEQLNRIERNQRRIEKKLDNTRGLLMQLLEALTDEEDEDEPQHDLDGNLIEGGERDENESLD